MTKLSCKACGQFSKKDKVFKVNEMMMGTREEFNYIACNHCGSLYCQTTPSNIEDYYSDSYYSLQSSNYQELIENKVFQRRLKRLRLFLFGNRTLNFLLPFSSALNDFRCLRMVKLKAQTKLLDVGSGSGEKFILPLSLTGMSNVLGIDPFIENDIVFPNGARVVKKTTDQLDQRFDVITYNHCLEHISNPVNELKVAQGLLNHDGVIIVRIPVSDSIAFSKYYNYWYQIDAPRHFFVPSKPGMQELAAKAGLKVFKIAYDSTYHQFWVSNCYKRNISMKEINVKNIRPNKIVKKIDKLRAGLVNRMGKGDQAIFYLRKSVSN